MPIHTSLTEMFPLANASHSIASLSDIKECLYGAGKNNVFNAAFGNEIHYHRFTLPMAQPAFDLLAKDVRLFLLNKHTETEESYDKWHHKTCLKFLETLNATLIALAYPPMCYGKAQKVLNMLMKYLYCCSDAVSVFPYKKFDYCHMALDGYTYFGIKNFRNGSYLLAFYRDIVFPRKYHQSAPSLMAWSNLDFSGSSTVSTNIHNDYATILWDIRELFATKHHTFNDFLSACHSAGIFTGISALSLADNRVLTPFEAEFFLWEICKGNYTTAITALY